MLLARATDPRLSLAGMKQSKPQRAGRRPQDSGLQAWHGQTLRILRRMHEHTQCEVATAIGVGRSTVQRWENRDPNVAAPECGANEPTPEQVRGLAKLLRVAQKTFAGPLKIGAR